MKIGGAPVECVFFDAVGTLIQPRELVGETYARFGARHGHRHDDGILNHLFLLVTRGHSRLGHDWLNDGENDDVQEYEDNYIASVRLASGPVPAI